MPVRFCIVLWRSSVCVPHFNNTNNGAEKNERRQREKRTRLSRRGLSPRPQIFGAGCADAVRMRFIGWNTTMKTMTRRRKIWCRYVAVVMSSFTSDICARKQQKRNANRMRRGDYVEPIL